jgi:hypothetical protein
MAEPAKAGKAPRVEAVREPQEPEHGAAEGAHGPGPCPVAWCPICLAVSTVQPLRPDVVEHLLKAGTELLLAFRGVIDARADQVAPEKDGSATSTRLEKIELG